MHVCGVADMIEIFKCLILMQILHVERVGTAYAGAYIAYTFIIVIVCEGESYGDIRRNTL